MIEIEEIDIEETRGIKDYTDYADYKSNGEQPEAHCPTTNHQSPSTEFCLGSITQIPVGEGREFQVGGKAIAVFLTRRGAVYATQALCPHRSGPLIDGLLGGTTLVCPLHAWKFDLATGRPVYGDCGIVTYPVRLTNGGLMMLTLTAD